MRAIPQTARLPACSADSFSGRVTSVPPALTLDVLLFRLVCGNHAIWGFQQVAGCRRRHVGASIQETWITSLDHVRATLDADPVFERTVILRATTQATGPTRAAVLEAVVQRLDGSQTHAAEAYT